MAGRNGGKKWREEMAGRGGSNIFSLKEMAGTVSMVSENVLP
jgi:hypothetical protein